MQWRGRRESNNIEQGQGGGRRGLGGGLGLKGGVGTLVLALVLWKFFGIDPRVVLNAAPASSVSAPATVSADDNSEQQQSRQFIAVVLADTEDTWASIFNEQGQRYQAPKLVLFRDRVQSGCGAAESATGPFYCPADQKVYLDLSFFADMRQNLGVKGEQNGSGEAAANQAGDFAQAYVIAHEIGHHIQNITGVAEQVARARQQNPKQANALSVRQELQADCFAGVWANRNQQRVAFLQDGDVAEAMDAASQIGDDRLQQRGQGYVVPESFTHGSSAQRMHWFERGFSQGQMSVCDTFKGEV